MKPCPFCGQTDALVVEVNEDVTNVCVVICKCGARGPQVPWQTDWQDSTKEYTNREAAGIKGIEFWNTRA